MLQRPPLQPDAGATAGIRRLLFQSWGEPLRSYVQHGVVPGRALALVRDIIPSVRIHWDGAARLAVARLGSHACCLGNRVYLGASVGTFFGPTLSEALLHELAHVGQVAIARRTGATAPRNVVEDEAFACSDTEFRGLPEPSCGADPDEIYSLW